MKTPTAAAKTKPARTRLRKINHASSGNSSAACHSELTHQAGPLKLRLAIKFRPRTNSKFEASAASENARDG